MAQGLLGALSAASIAETEVICHASAAVCGHTKGGAAFGAFSWMASDGMGKYSLFGARFLLWRHD